VRRGGRPRAALAGAAMALWVLPGGAAAQSAETLRLVGPQDGIAVVVERHRGYAAVPFRVLERIGWTVSAARAGGEAQHVRRTVRVRERSPFFEWDGALLQLTHEPYRIGDELWVPLQLLSDFLPERFPEDYRFETDPLTLRALSAGAWSTPVPELAPARRPARTSPPVRVVVIDPGHGGADPGAHGPAGTREKDVALALGLALAGELEGHPRLKVYLTRSSDRQVPLWERGEWATGIKGDRPGIFISIHANSGGELSTRGFETYFLSEARTEHERRVAALENAPFLATATADDLVTGDPALDFILRDLGNLDHQHWSALLAELVQERIAPVHSGPNRGVKQAPLAVITNALMPSVLLEVGFISNRAEERLLAAREFQTNAARAIASAVDDFFQRYPPGADEAFR